eukprot:Clim_evm8s152 gene=Clim_evmTU8s152
MSGKAAAEGVFRQLLRAAECWPKDEARAGRDFGKYLYTTLQAQINDGSLSESVAYEKLNAINKLTSDVYKKQFARERPDDTEKADKIRTVLSTESQAIFHDDRSQVKKALDAYFKEKEANSK